MVAGPPSSHFRLETFADQKRLEKASADGELLRESTFQKN